MKVRVEEMGEGAGAGGGGGRGRGGRNRMTDRPNQSTHPPTYPMSQ